MKRKDGFVEAYSINFYSVSLKRESGAHAKMSCTCPNVGISSRMAKRVSHFRLQIAYFLSFYTGRRKVAARHLNGAFRGLIRVEYLNTRAPKSRQLAADVAYILRA